ncbi:GNAT family N-acetyltransferase [Georgenia ruanii]|uniref:GNAT family N-acetyltransferase n=1 Tax=Georgenia ruanii TaxID=348442 RepID=A0A7J9UXB7_9MICO|nr:GNAT family N-acetyltransferase [Georgenia ruanii]MPV89267.1 GNAT family N-acetyltransferase [Georgenia ruanii]
MVTPPATVAIHPADADRWPDVERLFRGPGDPRNCWCAWWRLPRADYSATSVADRRALLAERVARPPAPGLLAYADGVPIGWVALAPRAEYPRIPRSTVITYEEVPGCWAVTCFYVHPDHRGRGLLRQLLAAAVEHARAHGAEHLEAYPVEPGPGQSDSGLFRGPLELFLRAGFVEVGRRRGRPTVRRALDGAEPSHFSATRPGHATPATPAAGRNFPRRSVTK